MVRRPRLSKRIYSFFSNAPLIRVLCHGRAGPRLSGGRPGRMRPIASCRHDPELLLYAKIAKRQPGEESVSVPRVARLLIVPAPAQAELQAIVLIGDPK